MTQTIDTNEIDRTPFLAPEALVMPGMAGYTPLDVRYRLLLDLYVQLDASPGDLQIIRTMNEVTGAIQFLSLMYERGYGDLLIDK